MRNEHLSLKKFSLGAGDVLISMATIVAALFLRHGGSPEPIIIALYKFAAPFLMILWSFGYAVFGLYDLKIARNDPRFFERLWRAVTLNMAVTAFLFYVVPGFRLKPTVTLIVMFATLGTLMSLWRALANKVLARIGKNKILFLGINDEVLDIAKFIGANPQMGWTSAGFMAGENGEDGLRQPETRWPVFGPEKNIAEIIKENEITNVIVAHHLKKTRALLKALFLTVPLGVTIIEFPRFYESVKGKVPVSLIGEAWFLENLIGMKRPKYEFAKRVLDLSLAFVFGLAALALLPFAALAIVFSTPSGILRYRKLRAHAGDGIIFFRQKRVGRNGMPFGFLKFRSQILGAEKLGWEKSEDKNDPRSYPFGNFLRKTYLDELPQIWNVIKGEMSFVGPRPERPEFVRELEEATPFYRIREIVLPGITGWAQVNMENDASVSDAPEKLQYDLYYIKNRSIFLDLMILLKTALKLLQRSGR